mmetsp:Transcript_2121/g.5377  ORF Transcript_2121/g.5377 Transcript_2121/m.5377 type:complete len:451 (-) Transcript_2121:1476-2828(-)
MDGLRYTELAIMRPMDAHHAAMRPGPHSHLKTTAVPSDTCIQSALLCLCCKHVHQLGLLTHEALVAILQRLLLLLLRSHQVHQLLQALRRCALLTLMQGLEALVVGERRLQRRPRLLHLLAQLVVALQQAADEDAHLLLHLVRHLGLALHLAAHQLKLVLGGLDALSRRGGCDAVVAALGGHPHQVLVHRVPRVKVLLHAGGRVAHGARHKLDLALQQRGSRLQLIELKLVNGWHVGGRGALGGLLGLLAVLARRDDRVLGRVVLQHRAHLAHQQVLRALAQRQLGRLVRGAGRGQQVRAGGAGQAALQSLALLLLLSRRTLRLLPEPPRLDVGRVLLQRALRVHRVLRQLGGHQLVLVLGRRQRAQARAHLAAQRRQARLLRTPVVGGHPVRGQAVCIVQAQLVTDGGAHGGGAWDARTRRARATQRCASHRRGAGHTRNGCPCCTTTH